jgi:hypothetical protein
MSPMFFVLLSIVIAASSSVSATDAGLICSHVSYD